MQHTTWSGDPETGSSLEQTDRIDAREEFVLAVLARIDRRSLEREKKERAVQRREMMKEFVRSLVLRLLTEIAPSALEVTGLFIAGEHCSPRVSKREIRAALEELSTRVICVGTHAALKS
jgi:hypothetical protein